MHMYILLNVRVFIRVFIPQNRSQIIVIAEGKRNLFLKSCHVKTSSSGIL